MSEPMSPESEVCPQCGCDADWSTSSWCESCGYYPAIGQSVGPDEASSEEEVVYENWWEAVPSWLWVLIGGMIGIFVTSVAIRVLFEESSVRMWWTAVQLAGGVVVFAVSHLMAYLYAAPNSDRIGPLDAFLKPIATWQPILRTLPKKVRLLWSVTWAMAAVITAFFVIDGIDYQAVMEARQQTAEKETKRVNPIAAIIQTTKSAAKTKDRLPQSAGDADSLGDALTEFTGAEAGDEHFSAMNQNENSGGDGNGPPNQGESGGTDPGGQGQNGGEGGPGQPAGTDESTAESLGTGILSDEVLRLSESIECIVVGYTTNDQGVPRSLLLAAPIHGRLTFVAKVSLQRVQPEAFVRVEERFSILRQSWPVVSSPYGGHWLKPKLFCHVRFSQWTATGRLSKPFVTEFAMVSKPLQERHDAALSAP